MTGHSKILYGYISCISYLLSFFSAAPLVITIRWTQVCFPSLFLFSNSWFYFIKQFSWYLEKIFCKTQGRPPHMHIINTIYCLEVMSTCDPFTTEAYFLLYLEDNKNGNLKSFCIEDVPFFSVSCPYYLHSSAQCKRMGFKEASGNSPSRNSSVKTTSSWCFYNYITQLPQFCGKLITLIYLKLLSSRQ